MKLAAAFLALVFVGCATAAAPKPTLRLTARLPVTVRGESFGAHERVVVTAFTGLGPRRVTVTASSGRFTVSLGSAKGCGSVFAVRAAGNAGSRAMLVVGGSEICVPPPR